ncbi:polyprotein pp220-like protein [Pacmanvirus S19]|nr:polyprotein pp220-like protein [Pacmanvirus S19]
MGSGISKTGLGQPIGYWWNMKPAYESDRGSVSAQVSAGKLQEISEGSPVPQGWEDWVRIDGKRYIKQQNAFRHFFEHHKQSIIGNAASAAKVSAGVVTEAAVYAIPALLEQGSDAAIKTLNARMPQLGKMAGPIVKALEEQLKRGVGNNATANQLYGRGESTHYEISDYAYRGAAQHYDESAFTGGFDTDEAFAEGGCGCNGRFIGSDELDTTTVRDYSNSLNSKTKNMLIKDIIDVAIKLGLKVTGDDLPSQIKSMLEQIPSGDRFKQSSEVHRKACMGIAEAINNVHGSVIIDKQLPPEAICQQVAEIVSSLSSGMHTEFLAVYNDVRKVLKNLHIIKNAMEDDHNAIMEKINNSDDADLSREVTQLNDLHKLLTEEIDRQIEMLSNLLNVSLMPSERDLASLIKSKKDLHGYVEKIDVKLGSDKFGKVISDILKGLGLTANFALIVERALKTVGMSLDEYAKATSVAKLREKVTQNLMGKTLSENELHEYLQAAELLYRNFYRNVDIAKKLEEKTGRHEMEMSGGEEKYAKSVLDKRILDRKKLRNLIFTAFYKRLNDLFDQFVNSLDIITLKVGTEIPLSDQLDSLRSSLQRVNLEMVKNKNIYHALIGYYNDAMSKSKKDALLGDFRMISSYIDTILEMPQYKASAQYFTTAQGYIKAIIELIDKYSEEIAAKFGRGEESPEYSGGLDTESPLLETPKIVFKTTKSIHDAIRQFDYKYRVAQIRLNMNATGRELAHYSEKYEKIVANSIADLLETDKKMYEKLRAQITSEGFKPENLVVTGDKDFGDDKMVAEQKTAALKFLDSQWETKKKFWATIEAVDTYMRVFTDALVRNPNDIKEIKSMIDEVEVINDWYSDATGNILSSVFEYFPSFIDGNTVHYSPDNYKYVEGKANNNHYYENIGNTDITSYPGNPYLVTGPANGLAAKAQVKRTFTGLAVLKNLLSVFVHVGSKFGGEEIRKKVFMTPTQMYNNLVEYLQASSFAQGFGIGNFTDALPADFGNSNNMGIQIDMITGEVKNRTGLGKAANLNWTDKTYVNGSRIVHLGVTSDPAVNVQMYDYTDQSTNLTNQIIDSRFPHSGAVWDTAGHMITTKVSEEQPLRGPTADNTQRALLFKKRWGVWMRTVISGLRDQEGFGFKTEDEYFVLLLKSIGAKIFTVTGMYDVLDRPMEYNGLSPIRMITGGSTEVPKIESEAVALYLRLPLLAVFYRNIFGFESDEPKFENYDKFRRQDKDIKISMVPDIDGTFAGLIRLIFRKTKFVNNYTYSDEDVKEIIREVNLIYQRMKPKYPENTVMETIHEFVAEINRRYGIVSKTERDNYEREFGYRYDYSTTGVTDRYLAAPETEYAILPGEGDDEIQRPSAAQRLLGETFDKPVEKTRPFNITTQHKELVYKFRCAIDKYFENPEEEYTFNYAIKSTQLKLKTETRDEERFKIVSSLIRGTDIYNKIDGMKYVMFHETVVSGLNLLSSMHSMLLRFKQRAHILDIQAIEDEIWKYFSNAGPKTLSGLRKAISEYITDVLGLSDTANDRIKAIVNKAFGYHEAKEYNGGHINNGTNADYALKAIDGVKLINAGAATYVDRETVGTFGVTQAGNNFTHVKSGLAFTSDHATPGADPMRLPGSGLFSILIGWGVQQLKDAYKGNKKSEPKRVADTFMRFIFNREYLMKELLETVFGFSHDFQGLVNVKVEDGRLYMNYGEIKTLVEDMFQHVGYFIDLLRPHVHADLIAKYTNKLTPGSYYWLQEQLMEKIIIGRPKQLVASEGSQEMHVGYASLDELIQKLSYTYDFLTREWNIDGSGLTSADVDTISTVSQKEKSRTSYDKVFAEMIFYDASRPSSGLRISERAQEINLDNYAAIEGVNIVDYLHDPYESLHFSGAADKRILDTRYIARFYQLYSWKDELTANRSAMFMFNQLIAKYIQTFYDPISSKIYGGVINQFAGGAFNRAIADHTYTYPDTVPMLHVKFTGDGESKIPSTNSLVSTLPVDNYPYIDTLTTIIRQLINYGTTPNDKNDSYKRSTLLKNLKDLTDKINVPVPAPNVNRVPSLYVYLLIHALGLTIKNLFDKAYSDVNIARSRPVIVLLSAGGVANDPLTLPALAATATINDVRAFYGPGTGSPTIEQIMNKLLQKDLDKTCELINLVFKFDGSAGNEMRINNSIFADVFGVNGAAPLFADTFGEKVKNLFNIVMRTRAVLQGYNYSQFLIPVMRIYPLDENIGRNDADTEYRARLFASMAVRLTYEIKEIAATPTPAGAPANRSIEIGRKVDEIQSLVTTVKSTYSKSVVGQPKSTLKYEDTFTTSDEFAKNTSLPSGSADVDYLVFARSESVENALPGNTIGKLEGRSNKGQPGPGSDSITGLMNFGRRMDPDGDHVLFTSLAVILKNLTTSRSAHTQALAYIQDNMADVPLYMKEKMRANLPAFRNLFKELITRCEFIKRFMTRSEMEMSRSYDCAYTGYGTVYKGPLVPDHNPWPYVLLKPTVSSDDTKNRYASILDSIIRGSTSIMSACDQVLREVGDDPKYFELYQNSIKDYKTQYGFDPLMPLSTTLAVLKNVDKSNYLDFFPIHSLGEDQFKFMYGTRSLLSQPTAQPLMEHNPGYMQLLEQFNLVVDSRMQVDKSRAESFMKSYVKMLRYVFELKHIKGLITPYMLTERAVPSALNHINILNNTHHNERIAYIDGMFTRDDLVLTNKDRNTGRERDAAVADAKNIYGDANNGSIILNNRSDISIISGDAKVTLDKNKYPISVYSITKPLADSIKLTESSFKDDKVKELVEYICNETKKRNKLEIQNIIDLNIVPINVHALMREIPLVNLYNYAYTFDRLIIELYHGLKNENARKLISELCDNNNSLKRITSAKDMLVALLLNPYMDVFNEDNSGMNYYQKYVKSMLVGVPNNGELGRPKFLSDQIYNKAIFGEIYESQNDYNEMGPAAGYIGRVNLNKEFVVTMFRNLLASVIGALSSVGSRFGALFTSTVNPTDVNLMQLCGAISKYVIENPNKSAENIMKLLVSKFFDPAKGVAQFKAFAANITTEDEARKFASLFATSSKLLFPVFMRYVKHISHNGVNGNEGGYIDDIAFTMTLLSNLGRTAGKWQGLDMTPGTPKSPASREEAAWALVDLAIKNYNARVHDYDNQLDSVRAGAAKPVSLARATDVFNKVIPLAGSVLNGDAYKVGPELYKLLRAEASNALCEDVNYGALGATILSVPGRLDYYSQISTLLSNKYITGNSINSNGEHFGNGRLEPSLLHWLDVVNDPADAEDRVRVQKAPHGDNMNVLDNSQVKYKDVTNIKHILKQVGRLRFDTVFIRNLVFITNLYRSVRMKLQRDLVYNKDIVMKSIPITRPQLTEFYGNTVDQSRQEYSSQLWKRYE